MILVIIIMLIFGAKFLCATKSIHSINAEVAQVQLNRGVTDHRNTLAQVQLKATIFYGTVIVYYGTFGQ